jgi:cyanophycinase
MSPAFALLGSGEFQPWTESVDRWLVGRTSVPRGPVLILPAASAPEGDQVFDMWANMGLAHYGRLGIPAEVVPLKTREDAENPALAARLSGAAVAYFSGGNPVYLEAILRESRFWTALLRALEDGMGYAGCSAGISILGELAPDSSKADPLRSDVWHPGLGLFRNVVLGPHWNMLDTYVPGLSRFIVDSVPDGSRLLTVDEETALVGDGTHWTVMGSGRCGLLSEGRWTQWVHGESFDAPLLEAAPT